MRKRVAILGGGIAGLTAAYYLLRAGAAVSVLEANPQLGGLSSGYDFGDFRWDRFYHCILPSDAALLELIDDLGLSERLRWRSTRVGYFTRGQLHSMSTTRDLLRFPGLSVWNKLRLTAGILYTCSIRDGQRLEEVALAEWMRRVFGNANYRTFWEPLLKCKLGASRERASAAFIWATITRLYSARKSSGRERQEKLGYLQGGYRTVLERLKKEIVARGGRICTGVKVTHIGRGPDTLRVTSDRGVETYDAVIATVPNRTLARIVPTLSNAYRGRLESAEYLGIVCFVLVLKRSLSAYYVTNLGDDEVPFTGIVEMTNLVSLEETAGHHLVYLPKYTAPEDPLLAMPEDELWELFHAHLSRLFPDLQESDIETRVLFRERYVQPIPTLRYSATMAGMETGVPGLFLANTTQIINSTLNNNAMVQIARHAVESVLALTPCQVRPHSPAADEVVGSR